MEAVTEIGLKDLDDDEQLALAALLRLLVRLDGEFSEAEQQALEEIALDFGEKRFWKAMEDAGARAPEEESIRAAAQRVTRTAARELIYGVLLGVAQSDVIQGRESSLLEWLSNEWNIGSAPAPQRG